jgi:acyl dehydratase
VDIDRIANLTFASLHQQFDARDAILYALSLGYGTDPLNAADLKYLYEDRLQAVPAVCNVLCHPGFWLQEPSYAVDWKKIVHAEQAFTLHQPLPPSGRFRAEHRIIGLQDNGCARGAMLHLEKILYADGAAVPLASVRSSILLRGDGGQGGFGDSIASPPALPKREPDRVALIATQPNAALIYRLNGDWNPLHIDLAVANSAGFSRPILHGLCTMGIACRALVDQYCGSDPTRLSGLFTRFSAPVYPGNTLRFEFHESDTGIRFKSIAQEREAVVLDRCHATLRT